MRVLLPLVLCLPLPAVAQDVVTFANTWTPGWSWPAVVDVHVERRVETEGSTGEPTLETADAVVRGTMAWDGKGLAFEGERVVYHSPRSSALGVEVSGILLGGWRAVALADEAEEPEMSGESEEEASDEEMSESEEEASDEEMSESEEEASEEEMSDESGEEVSEEEPSDESEEEMSEEEPSESEEEPSDGADEEMSEPEEDAPEEETSDEAASPAAPPTLEQLALGDPSAWLTEVLLGLDGVTVDGTWRPPGADASVITVTPSACTLAGPERRCVAVRWTRVRGADPGDVDGGALPLGAVSEAMRVIVEPDAMVVHDLEATTAAAWVVSAAPAEDGAAPTNTVHRVTVTQTLSPLPPPPPALD